MKLSGRLAKLRSMQPREIVYRIGYEACTAAERRTHERGRLAPPDRLRKALLAELAHRDDWQERLLRRRHAPKFFAWEDSPDRVRALFESRYADELARGLRIADRVARHEIEFFGQTFTFGPHINWHADPQTGAEWPRRYHRDVPVHSGNVGYGDVKYVWELNRHQFLVDLAKVAFLQRSERHASALHSLLQSWQASVPYATGAPWACALEPAFRVWSWLWAYHLVRASDLLPDPVHLDWMAGFYDHGRFLYRHLERYTSPYNHLVGEAAVLFILGVMFPEFRDSPAWIRDGRGVLESTVGDQFHADGGTVEQSTFYHHATLGFYMMAAILAARNQMALNPEVSRAIERGIDFSMALAQPDGRVPSIGGADDGKPLRLEHLPFWDFRPYQAIGAVMFSRPDFKAAAGRFHEDALWILGSEGADAFERLPSRLPEASRAFTASGYCVLRSGWSKDADYVCFDCGPQAAGLSRGAVPSAAHGHADCLSVIVTLAGRPVLVDPGFFCYNGDPEWEVHFRKTRAHNTLTVDGRDQARHVAKMAWTHTYSAVFGGWSHEGRLAWARGSHDGFARRRDGVTHQRTVWLRCDGYALLYDEITGAGVHSVQAGFQFAPGNLTVGPGTALFDDRFELAWTCTANVSASMTQGGRHAADGWIARSLGVREAAPRLELEFPFAPPRVALLTLVADRERAPGRHPRLETLVAEVPLLAARVRGRAGHDLVLASDGRRRSWRGIDTDAPLAVITTSNGLASDSVVIGGGDLRRSGAVLGQEGLDEPLAESAAGRN
jgi:hypothetical protein